MDTATLFPILLASGFILVCFVYGFCVVRYIRKADDRLREHLILHHDELYSEYVHNPEDENNYTENNNNNSGGGGSGNNSTNPSSVTYNVDTSSDDSSSNNLASPSLVPRIINLPIPTSPKFL